MSNTKDILANFVKLNMAKFKKNELKKVIDWF